jgi:hypothetical protein
MSTTNIAKAKLTATNQARARGFHNIRVTKSPEGVFGMAQRKDGSHVVVMGDARDPSFMDADLRMAKLNVLELTDDGREFLGRHGVAFDPAAEPYYSLLSVVVSSGGKLSPLGIAVELGVPFDDYFDSILELVRNGYLRSIEGSASIRSQS